ncbi:MAG TPA: DUF1674 domain-containing protein [Steroidobacteraceae bacterium]|nr:DUF1674 domain-containing protein [Steroidobacteraceae bacterium]
MSKVQLKGAETPPAAVPVPSLSADIVPPPPALQGAAGASRPRELGGVPGPDPTRFGDWEKNGRCIDF